MAIRIFIDQGHNPRDFNTGAEGNGFLEQDITYKVGRLLFDLFEENPEFEARLSRPTEDTLLGTNNTTALIARVERANAFGADLFLSLHANASLNPQVSGSECLVYSAESTVAIAVSSEILARLNEITGLPNRGIFYRPGLYVLRKTRMPAVLVELGFITNRTDAELMAYSPSLFAEAIYQGVLTYYGFLP